MAPFATPALNANALRQRRWRERQRNPIRSVSHVEYERDAVLRALINTGRLSQTDIWRRDLVERALSLVIAEWAAKVNKHAQTQAIANAIVRLSKFNGRENRLTMVGD